MPWDIVDGPGLCRGRFHLLGSLTHRVLGDVRDPLAVGLITGEVPLSVIIMDRGARLLAAPALARGGGPRSLLGAQTPDPALPDVDAGPLEFVGQEPVAERRIIAMRIDQSIDHIGVLEFPVTDRLLQPRVIRLGGEAEHPAGQPHRESLGGQVTDQRVRHFGSVDAAK